MYTKNKTLRDITTHIGEDVPRLGYDMIDERHTKTKKKKKAREMESGMRTSVVDMGIEMS